MILFPLRSNIHVLFWSLILAGILEVGYAPNADEITLPQLKTLVNNSHQWFLQPVGEAVGLAQSRAVGENVKSKCHEISQDVTTLENLMKKVTAAKEMPEAELRTTANEIKRLRDLLPQAGEAIKTEGKHESAYVKLKLNDIHLYASGLKQVLSEL
ncbi:hypothetical protein Ddc_17650 [Ditylenchus destructor]|nr:hypothetical protein Ddc_17650 [Ditylenchus destructor]